MSKYKNKQGGFLQLIILIIIIVCILAYFHVSIGSAFNSIVNAFRSVFS